MRSLIVDHPHNIGVVARWLRDSSSSVLREAGQSSDLLLFPHYWPLGHGEAEIESDVRDADVAMLKGWMFCVVFSINYLHGGALTPRQELTAGKRKLTSLQKAALQGIFVYVR